MNSNYRRLLFEGKRNFHIYFDEGRSGVVLSQYHNFHHCVYVTQGEFLHSQYGKEFTLRPGDCIFTPAGVEHGIHVFEDTSYFCLSFSQNIADSLFSHLPSLRRDFQNISSVIKVPEHISPRLCHCFSSLLYEQYYEENEALQTAHYLTISALIMLLRNEFPATSHGICFLDPGTEGMEKEILRSVQHINANYDQPLTIDELARISARSRGNFSKAFQQYTGKSVKGYITELRIKEAKRLLDTSNIPVQKIAEKVGYKEFSTFYRNFVQIVGISPTKYKESTDVASKANNTQLQAIKTKLP